MNERPAYCPDDLTEDEPCSACGATPWQSKNDTCRARYNGPKPRQPVRLVLVDRDTGEVI